MQLSIVRRIGSSKYATVSECQYEQGRRAAVKQIDKHAVSSFVHERILDSAAKWQVFKHPGLVAYQSVDVAASQIVMDLMEQSVETRIREGYGDAKTVHYVLRGILYGLAYLHQRGFVHANLKPSNVFFDSDGRIRLSDGYLYSMEAPVTLPKPINQKYLTPEHTSDAHGRMSPSTDLYAAGFIALELFAGDRFGRGFQGIGEEATDQDHAWFQWHGSSMVAPEATVFYKACPPELASVIAKLVQKNPSDRFASAQEALQWLPESLATETKAVAPSTAPIAKHVPSPNDILDRPTNGVVLVIASGSRAGTMLGTDDLEFAIGFEPDCLLRFSDEEYPVGHARVTCQRTNQGWMLSRVRGSSVFLNHAMVDERTPLRSGDIVRLSPRGPDIQFNLQSAGFSIKSLVSKYLTHRATPPRSVAPPHPTASVRDTSGVAPAPVRPANAAFPPATAAPVRPSSPMISAGKSHPPSPPAMRPPSKESASPAPVRPASLGAAPTRPAASIEGRLPTHASQPNASPSKATTVGGASAKGISMNPKEWTKSQTNWVITVVGILLIIVAVILTPSEQPNRGKGQGKTENAGSTEQPKEVGEK